MSEHVPNEGPEDQSTLPLFDDQGGLSEDNEPGVVREWLSVRQPYCLQVPGRSNTSLRTLVPPKDTL